MRFVSIVSSGLKAVILGGVLVSTQLQAQSNVTVRIMAANITSGNNSRYETPGLNIFQGLKPDIVAIQEFKYASTNGLGISTPAAIREMVDNNFGTNFFYFRETNTSFAIPNGIISRYPIVTNGSWVDSLVPDRSFAWAQIDLPGTNDLYVVSVHLYSSGSAADRNTEATTIKTRIQSDFPPNAWVIVAGDFNTDSRSEAAITTFTTFLSDNPKPADLNGDLDTNRPRNKPFDYVLPSFSMTNTLTPVVLPSHTFPNGLIFVSTNYVPLSDVSPVQLSDSDAVNMQHHAVVKDFLIPVSGTTNAPSISSQPQSLIVSPGSNVTFSVTAAGTAPLAYQWRYNGTNISGAMTNSYALNNAQFTNAGNYLVVVTNIAGSVTSSVAVLIVTNLPPDILTNPVALSVFVGSSATFSVTATGTAPLFYQWRLDGINLAGASTNSYSLNNIQLTNAGNYTVVVTNFAGSITSAPGLLTVNTNVTGTSVLLAGWDTSTQVNFGNSPLLPSTNAPNLTIAGLTRGGGVVITGSASAGGWGGSGFDAASVANAVSAGDFATFSVAANTGYNVSFGSISRFDYRRSSTGPATGVLQYQVGAGAFVDITNLAYPTSGAGDSIGAIDLSGIAPLQNVSSNTVVTFRIVNYGGALAGTWYIYNTISGTAPDLVVQGIINSMATTTNPPAAAPVLGTPAFSGGQIQFNISGTAGSNYIVLSATNLVAPNWIPLRTNPAPFTFTETNLGLPQKFYRAVAR